MIIKSSMYSCLLLILISSCERNVPDTEDLQKKYPVTIEQCNDTIETISIHSSGILTSKRICKLSFKSGGIVSHVYVDKGWFVKKGQVLARIDMTEIESGIKQASLALEKAERDLQRIKNLFEDSVATLEQLQNSTSVYNAALDNSKFAEYKLQLSRIVAPADGRIIAKLAEENEIISSGMPVFVFAAEGNNDWIVKTGVADKDATKIKDGTRAIVKFDAFPDREFHAQVINTACASEQSSGTFEIELSIDSDNELFVNGLVANVTMHLKGSKKVTMIPLTSLVEVDGVNGYVYEVNMSDSTVKKIHVTISSVHTTGITILESLQKTNPIVTQGTLNLYDGAKVNIVK